MINVKVKLSETDLACLVVACAVLSNDIDLNKSDRFSSVPVDNIGLKLMKIYQLAFLKDPAANVLPTDLFKHFELEYLKDKKQETTENIIVSDCFTIIKELDNIHN